MHAMPSRIFGAESAGHYVSVRTTCGREIRIGHLALGGGLHPAQRVSLGISASSDTEDGTWAGSPPMRHGNWPRPFSFRRPAVTPGRAVQRP